MSDFVKLQDSNMNWRVVAASAFGISTLTATAAFWIYKRRNIKDLTYSKQLTEAREAKKYSGKTDKVTEPEDTKVSTETEICRETEVQEIILGEARCRSETGLPCQDDTVSKDTSQGRDEGSSCDKESPKAQQRCEFSCGQSSSKPGSNEESSSCQHQSSEDSCGEQSQEADEEVSESSRESSVESIEQVSHDSILEQTGSPGADCVEQSGSPGADSVERTGSPGADCVEQTSSPGAEDVDSSKVIKDENDIFIITEEAEQVKVERSELAIVHPHTKEIKDLGCTVETEIEERNGRQSSKHKAIQVSPKGLLHTILREGCFITGVNGITTEAMTSEMLVQFFLAVTVDESHDLKLTVQKETQDEYGNPEQNTTLFTIKFRVGPNELCVETPCMSEPVIVVTKKPIQLSRHGGKSFQEEKCWIQNLKTQMYVRCNESGVLVLDPLRPAYSQYKFKGQIYTGMDKVDGSTDYGKMVFMFAFHHEAQKEVVTQFMAATGDDSVGLLKLQSATQTIRTLNEQDPRYFYHIKRVGSDDDYFRSLLVQNHYLGCVEDDSGKRTLCLVEVKNESELYKYDNLAFKVTNANDKTDIPTDSKVMTTV